MSHHFNMNIEIIRNKTTKTKLTVNKDRITIKLGSNLGNEPAVIDFLTRVGHSVQNNPLITKTLRGALNNGGITLFNDSKTESYKFYVDNFPKCST
jgi:hypothetical protein